MRLSVVSIKRAIKEMSDNSTMQQSSEEPKLTLLSSDGVEFSISLHHLAPCRLIQDATEEENEDNYNAENYDPTSSKPNPIPILNVTSDSLSNVVTFLTHYSVEPICIEKPFLGETLEDIVKQEWYLHFIQNLSQENLFKLANAANYMDIAPLYDLCMLQVSILFMDKTPDEIRSMLGMRTLTPEEELRAREEFPWLFVQE